MVIVTDFERPPREIVDGFTGHASADVHEAMGKRNAMAPRIDHVGGPPQLCGPACTVRVPAGDNMMAHVGVEYAQPGDVLVVAAESDRAATWGELSTRNAMRRGIDGIVTGGNVRDSAWLSRSEFPVFAPAVSQAGAVKETPGSVNVPVVVGDVSVSPGDIVVGDADGVTVVPRQEAAAILEATERKVEHEEDIRRRIDDGESLCEILGLEETLADHDISIVDDLRESFDPDR